MRRITVAVPFVPKSHVNTTLVGQTATKSFHNSREAQHTIRECNQTSESSTWSQLERTNGGNSKPASPFATRGQKEAAAATDKESGGWGKIDRGEGESRKRDAKILSFSRVTSWSTREIFRSWFDTRRKFEKVPPAVFMSHFPRKYVFCRRRKQILLNFLFSIAVSLLVLLWNEVSLWISIISLCLFVVELNFAGNWRVI